MNPNIVKLEKCYENCSKKLKLKRVTSELKEKHTSELKEKLDDDEATLRASGLGGKRTRHKKRKRNTRRRVYGSLVRNL